MCFAGRTVSEWKTGLIEDQSQPNELGVVYKKNGRKLQINIGGRKMKEFGFCLFLNFPNIKKTPKKKNYYKGYSPFTIF